MIFRADDISKAEHVILSSYFKATRSIAGCQAIRRRIGHCLLGMRAVYGECVFVTVSPNRRHSGMVLHLSRVRVNDPTLRADSDVARARAMYAGSASPSMFLDGLPDEDVAVEEAYATLDFPALRTRQALNAQDPLSSVHHYLFCIRVLLPAAFGVRLCFNCPHCNADDLDEFLMEAPATHPCQDCFGSNAKPMGGFAGLADTLGFATEHQGEGTPHGHGFVSLVNAYQHGTLKDIAALIEANGTKAAQEAELERLLQFMTHLKKEDHFDHEKHEASLPKLERDFHLNNEGHRMGALYTPKSLGKDALFLMPFCN